MTEFIVVMRKSATPEQYQGVVGAIVAQGGRVMMRFPPGLIFATGEAELLRALRDEQGVRQVTSEAITNPERLALDEAGALALQAWNLRMSDEYKATKAARPDEGAPWDHYQAAPPGGDVIPLEDAGAPLAMSEQTAKAAPVNTSRYMIGTVAVGVIIVDGPAGSTAAFTAAERTTVVAEVQEGTTHLIDLSPAGANLNFIFDVHTVTLALAPAAVANEVQWRDPAMAALGYAAGSAGMYDYLHDLRTHTWTTMCPGPDWAYVAFFTKYAAPWFAYASLGGPRLVMQYSNDGWGPSQIDRVFAHESGHIFGAADEYASSGCSLGGAWGYLGVANNNCANGNPASIDCLMKANTYNMCQWSAGQLGWRDSDADGVPDPIDLAPGTYATDVGINPGAPFYNNADLWVRNANDGEATQVHQNPRSNQDNFIYAKVRNFGGVTAEVVRTRFYIANFTGTEFVFPADYTNLINAPDTPCPTVFSLTPGASAISHVRLRQAQIPPSTWHPCLLVHVSTAQEGPVPAGSHVWDSNNLAQKNMVIDYIAPSQTLVLPIVLQNITSLNPFFELRRIEMPAAAKLQLQFQNRMLRPQIIRQPVIVERPIAVLPIQPRLITGLVPRAGETAEPGQCGVISLKLLNDADVELYLDGELQDLGFHLAAGSVISERPAPAPVPVAEVEEEAAPVTERDGRLFFPIPTTAVTRFKLPVAKGAREVAGISLTAPANANVGDTYTFELVQYNDDGKPVGGITFQINVVSRIFTLRELDERIGVLRKVGLDLGNERFGDLADAAQELMALHSAVHGGAAADATSARSGFSALLKDVAKPEVWGYSMGALTAAAAALDANPSFAADLDALTLLLYHAQERLLTDLL
jgi:hypothetical protein